MPLGPNLNCEPGCKFLIKSRILFPGSPSILKVGSHCLSCNSLYFKSYPYPTPGPGVPGKNEPSAALLPSIAKWKWSPLLPNISSGVLPVKWPPPHIPCRLAAKEFAPYNVSPVTNPPKVVSTIRSCPGAKNDKCIKCLPTSPLSEYVLVSTPTPCSVELPVIPLSHLLGPTLWSATVVTNPSKPFIWLLANVAVVPGVSLFTFCRLPIHPSTFSSFHSGLPLETSKEVDIKFPLNQFVFSLSDSKLAKSSALFSKSVNHVFNGG